MKLINLPHPVGLKICIIHFIVNAILAFHIRFLYLLYVHTELKKVWNEPNKKKVIIEITRIFHLIYFTLCIIGIGSIVFHYYIYNIDEHIIYIVSRAIFVMAFSFLASYYRLINKPHNGLYVTIIANVLSLIFLFFFKLVLILLLLLGKM